VFARLLVAMMGEGGPASSRRGLGRLHEKFNHGEKCV
jgi:hypothetical protein